MSLKLSAKIFSVIVLLTALGCAHGKLGKVSKNLEKGAISKNDSYCVGKFDTSEMTATGDKSSEEGRLSDNKKEISSKAPAELKVALAKDEFKVANEKKNADCVKIEGKVGLFDYGSAAKRAMIGMGAGASGLTTVVSITKKGELLSQFEVIATSGGRGGFTSMGSFLDAHVEDTAKKIVDYMNDSI